MFAYAAFGVASRFGHGVRCQIFHLRGTTEV
jgi:hypothetical protein